MATETMDSVQTVPVSDPDYEKVLRKAYGQGRNSQGQQQIAASGSTNVSSFENKMYAGQNGGSGGGSWSEGGSWGSGGTRGGSSNSNGSLDDASYINQMYDSNLESQKQTLQSNYETNVSNLDAEKETARRESDADLNRTYIEALRDAKNYGEVQNAYGLTSGAMGQARLAQNNQLQSDLTTLRSVQEQVQAELERQRSILAKEYGAAIAKAQADNDFQRAQALYEAAKAEEERNLQMQAAAGELMASVGDYSILGKLYGLSSSQIAALQAAYEGDSGSSGGGSGSSSGGSSSTQKTKDDDTAQVPATGLSGNNQTYNYETPTLYLPNGSIASLY